MNSIRILVVCATLILSGFIFHQQDAVETVQDNLYKKLSKKISNKYWSIKKTTDGLEMMFADEFGRNTSISPLYMVDMEPDTLWVRVRLEDGWNNDKADSIAQKNKAILQPLYLKFKAHYDSLNWRGVKSNPEMFEAQPYSHISWWNGLTVAEKQSLKELVVLPDTIIYGVGIFVQSDYNPPYMVIVGEKANKRFFPVYNACTEVLGRSALYKLEDNY